MQKKTRIILLSVTSLIALIFLYFFWNRITSPRYIKINSPSLMEREYVISVIDDAMEKFSSKTAAKVIYDKLANNQSLYNSNNKDDYQHCVIICIRALKYNSKVYRIEASLYRNYGENHIWSIVRETDGAPKNLPTVIQFYIVWN